MNRTKRTHIATGTAPATGLFQVGRRKSVTNTQNPLPAPFPIQYGTKHGFQARGQMLFHEYRLPGRSLNEQ